MKSPTSVPANWTVSSTDAGLAGVEGLIPINVTATSYTNIATTKGLGYLRIDRSPPTGQLVGVPSAVQAEFPYLRMWLKSLTFRAGWCNVQAYMRPMLDLIAAGRLHPEKIISHRMKLEQAEEAYRMFDAREATKIVLTP